MKNIQIKPGATHILLLDGEQFPIYHKERRLYSFVDWKDSRDKLIKILLAKIKTATGENTALITFKMANPMRKTRLGNFFIDLIADIKVKGRSLGTLEDLGMKNIFIDRFETLDPIEKEMRSHKEASYAEEQYAQELKSRMENLSNSENLIKMGLDAAKEHLIKQAKDSMEKEGWSTTLDNRARARSKRSI